jgi:hypothetical protein
MTKTAEGLKPISPEEAAKFEAILSNSLAAARLFEMNKGYFPHPTGDGRDHVFIISNQMGLNALQLDMRVNQALNDFPSLTKEGISIKNDFNSDGQLSFWGIEFPSTDKIPPTYTKLERSPR